MFEDAKVGGKMLDARLLVLRDDFTVDGTCHNDVWELDWEEI